MVEYHANKGTMQDIIVSHSILNLIDPEIGGHPSKVVEAIVNGETESTPSMKNGTLLHLWAEKQDKFIVNELDNPSPQMVTFAEFFNYLINNYEKNEKFLEYCKLPIHFTMDDIFKINEIYSGLYGTNPSTEQFDLFSRAILFSRTEAQVDKRLKVPTILEKFQVECIPYITFLQKSNGKIPIDKSTRTILTNCIESVKVHKIARDLFALPTRNEEEFYWSEEVNGVIIRRKAKIDKYLINVEEKSIIIIDLKTTSDLVAKFNLEHGAVNKYKLARQLVNYLEAIIHKYNLNMNEVFMSWDLHLINIVVQTTENYPCIVYQLTDNTITHNRLNLDRIKHRIAKHINTNIWDLTIEEIEKGYVEI